VSNDDDVTDAGKNEDLADESLPPGDDQVPGFDEPVEQADESEADGIVPIWATACRADCCAAAPHLPFPTLTDGCALQLHHSV
jgi:hypothetical protein